MALKRTLTKADYDKLPDAVKFEYKQDGDNYVLDIEGYEDPGELKRAKDRESQAAKEAKAEAKKALEELAALKAQLEDDGTLTAKKKGDIEALEKSWQAKIDKATADAKGATDKARGQITKLLRDGTAAALATKLAGDASDVLLPHLMSRLNVDFEGDEPALRVIGADGKPTAATVAELEQEFVANPKFAAIIIGSKASGGGAGGGKQGSGGARKKFAEMNEAERTTFYKEDPDGFRKASEAAKSESTVL